MALRIVTQEIRSRARAAVARTRRCYPERSVARISSERAAARWGCRRLAIAAGLASAALLVSPAAPAQSIAIKAGDWRLAESQSGPVNYYSQVTEGGATFVRSRYVPPLKTAVVAWQAPDAERTRLRKLSFTWRARSLPKGGDECADGREDSAAVVYVTWKRGLRYYTLKYVWSSVGQKGKVCGRKRNPFVAQDTIILESGPSNGTWRKVELDLVREWRRHFAEGDAEAEVPAFAGIGLMSDGDQTRSESSADYGVFTVSR